jgi:hypothetical protein
VAVGTIGDDVANPIWKCGYGKLQNAIDMAKA